MTDLLFFGNSFIIRAIKDILMRKVSISFVPLSIVFYICVFCFF